jgi:hypothetical protein
MRPSDRRYLLALAVVGALTACGSTVQQASSGVLGAGGSQAVGGDGLLLSPEDGGATAEGSAGSVAEEQAAASGGTVGGAGTIGSSPTGASGRTAGAPGGSSGTAGAPGAAAAAGAPVRIGVTVPDTAALAATFGEEPNDASAWFKRVIDYVNKTGGIADRRIAPSYYKADVSQDGATAGQRACTAFTEDSKVDIVINAGVIGDTFPACLARAGISAIETGVWTSDGEDEGRFPNRFAPFAMRIDRQIAALISVSAERGTIKRGDTLGVLVEDCPRGARVMKKVVEPQAQRFGLKVVKGTHKCIENLVSDLGPVTNDIQRETLRFNQAGVTHVIVVSFAEAFGVAQFTQNASQQRYYPKYIVTSNAYPYGNSQDDAVIKISPDAVPNVSGAGYIPLLDVGHLAAAENADQKEQQARCKQADPSLGGSESGDSGRYFQRHSYYNVCDSVYVVKALLEANGVRYGLADVTRGYRTALSGNRQAAGALGGGYFGAGAGRLDGVGFVRPFAYDASRKAFAYTGGPIAQP